MTEKTLTLISTRRIQETKGSKFIYLPANQPIGKPFEKGEEVKIYLLDKDTIILSRRELEGEVIIGDCARRLFVLLKVLVAMKEDKNISDLIRKVEERGVKFEELVECF